MVGGSPGPISDGGGRGKKLIRPPTTTSGGAAAVSVWQLPDEYVMTEAFLMLRVCERFGLRRSDLDALPPHELAELLAFDRVRDEQDRRTRTP